MELRDKWFEDKTNYSFYANCDLTMQAYVCELDSNKKTLLDRNEEMNENKEHFGDLVGFFWKKIKKG